MAAEADETAAMDGEGAWPRRAGYPWMQGTDSAKEKSWTIQFGGSCRNVKELLRCVLRRDSKTAARTAGQEAGKAVLWR